MFWRGFISGHGAKVAILENVMGFLKVIDEVMQHIVSILPGPLVCKYITKCIGLFHLQSGLAGMRYFGISLIRAWA